MGGAALGNGLGDELRVAGDVCLLAEGRADGLFVGRGEVVDGLADEVLVGPGEVDDGLAGGLVLALGVPSAALPLAEAVGVGEPAAPGENVGVEGEDPVQAESEAEASTVTVAKPAAVNFALSPLRAKVPKGLFITEDQPTRAELPSEDA